ncbi:hypothetical protein GGR28_002444 [Lewinella aquimaris]|uniref:Uncharacterized protein n=1 Tax=Neolewinella aquimaris TaxID=1835722 RepID=A0A840E913_9BACT|nr:hypothetical protein [Neolewinella aquimaris]MBB4079817.1 hypothetical protein [Neolewinella aquimaris]
MPKALTERFIQNAVAERLNDKYYGRKSAYVSTEVYTRLKRADVLLSFMRAKGRPYVVVVEAKSRTTIHQLKLRNNPKKVQWTGRLLTLAFFIALSGIIGYEWYFNALNTTLLLLLFVAGSLIITSVVGRLKLSVTKSISAIEQLGRYPANESWIAVGEDTFVNAEQFETLRQQCRKNGVGLLIVDARGRLTIREIPRPRHIFNDYLSRYGKRREILAVIDRNPSYGATPPERKQNRRRFLNIGLLLLVTALLVLLVYEKSYGPVIPDPFADPRFDSPADVRIGERTVEAPEGSESTSGTAPAPPPADDCKSAEGNQRLYIVVDAILPAEEATVRLTQLRAAGMRGHRTLNEHCLTEGPTSERVVIYTGTTYDAPTRADAAAADYRRLLNQLGQSPIIAQSWELK